VRQAATKWYDVPKKVRRSNSVGRQGGAARRQRAAKPEIAAEVRKSLRAAVWVYLPHDVITAVADGRQPVVESTYTRRLRSLASGLAVVRDFTQTFPLAILVPAGNSNSNILMA
jgi:hypothetical protein